MIGKLKTMFRELTGQEAETVKVLSAEGSHRKYVRLSAGERSLMGVEGTSTDENRAFISMSAHFRSKGLAVPEVLAVSEDELCYLQEDLGDRTLFNALAPGRSRGCYSEEDTELLVRTIRALPEIQIRGAEGFDFQTCCSVPEFGARQIMFDLNYFKYSFLKPFGLEFNEDLLEDDFCRLREDLCQVPGQGFLYRDFQSRNVMLVDGKPWFIDFQGGQKGPHHYDLASFVWQAKAAYPAPLKERLVSEYLDALKQLEPVDETRFRQELRIFVLFRTLQVLGSYGFRGWFERKKHFLESIPYAMTNLRELLSEPFEAYPYLTRLLQEMCARREAEHQLQVPVSTVQGEHPVLEVQISSFSYKVGIPADESGNGGGYVFDCRYMHNPGRYEQYRKLTGMDQPVIDFLEKDGEIFHYLDQVYGLVDPHVETFLRRGFSHLQVSFGCTGGQHRSVYCAEALAKHLLEKYGVRIHLRHIEQQVDKVLEP